MLWGLFERLMELLDIAPPEMGDFDVPDLGYDDLPAHDLVASNSVRPQVDFYVAIPGLTTTFRPPRFRVAIAPRAASGGAAGAGVRGMYPRSIDRSALRKLPCR